MKKSNQNAIINEVVIIENDDETSSLKLSDESDSSDSESMEAISINDKKEIEEVIQELSNGPSNISKSLQFEKENKHAKFKYLQHLSIQRYLQLLLDGSTKMAESQSVAIFILCLNIFIKAAIYYLNLITYKTIMHHEIRMHYTLII